MKLVVTALALLAAAPVSAGPVLLPTPASVRANGDGFTLGASTRVEATGPEANEAARRLAELMASQGVALGRTTRANGPLVRFVHQPGLPAEGYRLAATPRGAVITASDGAGLIHGAVTLWQLASQGAGTHQVEGVVIEDQPRFRWRGLMLDSARHFQSPAYIRHLLDWMMANKLNRLHWHLVDDQGWRLPIPGYPRLTQVSAWRRDATAPGAPPLPVTGGFYTPTEVKGIVAYAAARGITIIPEIEMPGHALAAIRAYPALGMDVRVPAETWSDYGVFPWLYNTEDSTFHFIEAVLTEVMRLFPSRDIHIGGDEAVKDQWRASPRIQAQIRALGLKDEDALQGWFMARVGRFLSARGRRPIGWDEILDGGVPPDAAITSWRGMEGAIKAAKTGHDAILSPAPTLYLDNRQGTGPEEPPGRGRLIPLADVLAFEPVPPSLNPAEQRHILGLQANLWTEHVRTEARAAWMTFPRAAAIAEIGWAPQAHRDVASFSRQLAPQLARLAPLGLQAADSVWAVSAQFDGQSSTGATGTLGSQTGLPIHYTLDGTPPTTASPRYIGPIAVHSGQRLRAATFLEGAALAGAYDRPIDATALFSRTSRELTLCSDAVALDLEDDYPARGPRAHFLLDAFHPCWRWPAAPLNTAHRVVIDVGQIPFNFQVGADRDKIRFRPPATPAGEFEVRQGGCEGRVIATLPLAAAALNPGVTRLQAPLPPSAQPAELCISYTAKGVDPLWAVERVTLIP